MVATARTTDIENDARRVLVNSRRTYGSTQVEIARTENWLRRETESAQTQDVARSSDDVVPVVLPASDASATSMPAKPASVEAVVSEVGEDFIVLRCVSEPVDLEVRFPSNLVPSDLRFYGAPVSVSLGTEGGYRIPVISARPPAHVDDLPGQSDVEAWLASI